MTNIIFSSMNFVKSSEEAQMMTLEAFIASLLIIVAVLFVVSQVPPQVQQEGGYSEVQLRHYGEDVMTMLESNASPDENYENLLQYYVSENKYKDLDDFLNDSLPDNVGYSVALVSGDEREDMISKGYPMGKRIVVSEIVVSKNTSIGGLPGVAAGIKKVNKTFPAGSLIIPMDDKSIPETGQENILKAMGLVYNIANGTYSDGKPISVWQLLEDPRGENYTYFNADVEVNTNNNPINISIGNNDSRKYGGGPYIIDENDLTQEIKDRILNASEDSSVAIHQTLEPFEHDPVAELKMAPKIAAYPPDGEYYSTLNETIGKYYEHSNIPFTTIDNSMISSGVLDDIDIITIPHANLTEIDNDVTRTLIDWVSNGGTIYAEGLSLTTLDAKVELIDGDNHPWNGFIGVSNSLVPQTGRSMIFVGNSSIPGDDNINPYGTYADPGAFWNVLAQSGDTDGVLMGTGMSEVPAFNFTDNSKVNPDTTILAGAGTTNSSALMNNSQLTYISAPFDKGFVIYLAGHNMSVDYKGDPTPHRERLIFHTLFYPGFRKIYDYGVVELQITMWYK
jgi:hypothetical protein